MLGVTLEQRYVSQQNDKGKMPSGSWNSVVLTGILDGRDKMFSLFRMCQLQLCSNMAYFDSKFSHSNIHSL